MFHCANIQLASFFTLLHDGRRERWLFDCIQISTTTHAAFVLIESVTVLEQPWSTKYIVMRNQVKGVALALHFMICTRIEIYVQCTYYGVQDWILWYSLGYISLSWSKSWKRIVDVYTCTHGCTASAVSRQSAGHTMGTVISGRPSTSALQRSKFIDSDFSQIIHDCDLLGAYAYKS